MLVSEDEVAKRLNNPLNLINRMHSARSEKRANAMSLFIRPENKFIPPREVIKVEEIKKESLTEEIVDSSDDKIRLALAHDEALNLLVNSVSAMKIKLDDIKPEKIPSVITAASKVVESIRKERLERSKNDIDNVHFHFYAPAQRKIEEYEVIEVAT